jgi:hypothetical protein
MHARAAVLLLAIPICAANTSATTCVEVGGASFLGTTGWNHIVYLTNRCSLDVVCDVSTNVEPEPKQVTCMNNETVAVPMSTNASERVFSPVVSCDYP